MSRPASATPPVVDWIGRTPGLVLDGGQSTGDPSPLPPSNPPLESGMKTAPTRFTLVGLVLGLVIVSATAELAFQALVGIPHRVVVQQSEVARGILSRQARALNSAMETGQGALIETTFQLESDNPDLRWLALVDHRGRITQAIPSTWEAKMRHRTVEGLTDLGPFARGTDPPWIHVDPPGETLTAALPISLKALEAKGRSTPMAAPPAGESAPPGPTTLGTLYLALDLRRPNAAAWGQRLAPRGWLPWAIATGIAILLLVELAERRIRRPLRQLLVRLGPRDPEMAPLDPERGKLAELATRLGTLRERAETPECTHRAPTQRWRLALEEAAGGIWDWDPRTNRIYYTPRCLSLLGLAGDPGDDQLEAWLTRIHPEDIGVWQAAVERHHQGETQEFLCEHRLRAQGGEWRWVIARGRALERDQQGHPLRVIGNLTDITDRKTTERSLAYLVNLELVLLEASRALSAAQPEAVEAVVERVLGALARRMDVEHASLFAPGRGGQGLHATHAWGLIEGSCNLAEASPLPEEQLPRWMETLRHGEDIRIVDVAQLPSAWEQDRGFLSALGVRAVAAVPLRTGVRLGGFLSLELQSGPREWRDSELRALRLLADLLAATLERRRFELELMQSRQRLEEIALYDTLTRLPNRRLLGERMQVAMAAAVEAETQLAVCYLDLDGFKSINDQRGRTLGDLVLKAAATRLREQVRESDTVARLGGDEFVLLMGGFDSLIECANALDRLVKNLAQPYRIEDEELRVTASIGVILYPRDSHDADTLLRHADYAMYQAKQRGRNRVRFFDTVRDRRAHARRSQLERFGEAIEGKELRLYYQPQVDMRQGRVLGVEGLVRWQHPTKGLLLPGSFIPLLDGHELQQRLDWWVIEAGLAQLESWHGQGLDLGLSLNVSARSVQNGGFVTELGARLDHYRGLAPQSLSLEILESEALGDLDAVANVIARCEDLGVGFALDDFGTGYSSLTYFRRLPAQVLKIDQTFVRDMLRSQDDRNIVEGVVGLARAFQREVIAEGVESAAHGLMLLDLGCNRAQGFGVAEPMAPDQLLHWMATYVPPPLWGMKSPFDWATGDILDLLTMESVHRDWVARLLRTSTGGGGARPPELAEGKCGFGRWYYGQGRKAFGDLEYFQALEVLHDQVHARARELLRSQDLGARVAEGIRALVDARDRFLVGLHQCQERVLSDLR